MRLPDNEEPESAHEAREPIRREWPCPVCERASLTGYVPGLPEERIRFNRRFLECAAAGEPVAALAGLDHLTPFELLLCPHDLFTCAGRMRGEGALDSVESNIFLQMRRYVRANRPRALGQRVQLFASALLAAGVEPIELAPSVDTSPEAAEIFIGLWRLLDGCLRVKRDPLEIRRRFAALADGLSWNPFERILADLWRRPPVLRAILELQLADLIYLLRRRHGAKAFYPTYETLYETVNRLKNLLQHVRNLSPVLIAEFLFHMLRMADLVSGERRELVLQTAYEASSFLVARITRPGVDLNRSLDRRRRNPDVLLYLKLRLAHDMGFRPPDEELLLAYLDRRLAAVRDYTYPGDSPAAQRIALIGAHLRAFLDELAREPVREPARV